MNGARRTVATRVHGDSKSRAIAALFAGQASCYALGVRTLGIVCVALVACAVVGCMPAEHVALRYDPNERVVDGHDLAGIRVAVRTVRDVREDPEMGRHRDGLARVTQYAYVPEHPVDASVRSTLEATLREARASVVPAGQPADLTFDIDVVALDVTTDGPLAGEETFGEIALRVAAYDVYGRQVVNAIYRRPFADDDRSDPAMAGDALHALAGTIVRSIQRASASSPTK